VIRPLPKPTEPSPLWQNAKEQSGETSWPVQVEHMPPAGGESASLAPPSPLIATYLADYIVIAVLSTILVYLWMQ
jgi:hypothetical protein